jgi:stage IV sporulation protein FB
MFRIHPFYFIVAFICMFTGNFKGFVVFNCIIFIHELGHVFTAKYFGWKIDKVLLLPFGAITIFNEKINRPLKEEFMILIMGPLVQMVVVGMYEYFNYDVNVLNYSNMILFFNLLPIYPLDGARLINIVCNKLFSFKMSHLLTIYISLITILGLILFVRFNLILFLILIFIFKRVIVEFKNHGSIFEIFLFERYTNVFDFKKVKKVNNVKKMKRDYRHIIFFDGRYISENKFLKRLFDFKGKM